MPVRRSGHAVVLGGSIAGLLATRVLAQRYATVTVVERDRLPALAAHRAGVPQGHHVHGLLPCGLRVLDDLLPGVCGSMVERGALTGDVLANIRWYAHGGMLRQASAGLPALCASRPLIEAAIRDRVDSLPAVEFRDRHVVTGLRLSDDRRRVAGVRVRCRDGGSDEFVAADLVIDATGRRSQVRRWLAELGYPPPPADLVRIDLWYATRVFAAPAGGLGPDIMVAVAGSPALPRSGVLQRIEGGRVLVTLAGMRGHRPPVDPRGFAEYAASLAVSDIASLTSQARPLTNARAFRCPTYVRHRYEQVAAFPAGLLPIGDALCSFNPVYAEGITVAARSAATLREHLDPEGEPRWRPYFRAVGAILDAPWGTATGSDLAASGMDRPGDAASAGAELSSQYLDRVQQAAAHDEQVAIAFVRVAGLVDPPAALWDPAVRRRVERVAAGWSGHHPVPAPT